MAKEQASLLEATLPAGAVLCGWSFAATGYTTGNPVFLSMDIGAGYSTEALSVWHFDGSAWTPYAAGDLSYDGDCANFTVTGFSGYAVTAVATPEPGALALLGLGSMILTVRRRRR